MNSRASKTRARVAAGATVLGLGALGATALGTNPGHLPGGPQAQTGRSVAVTTAASGTSTAAVAQPAPGETAVRRPIVTRSSGGGAPAAEVDD